MIVGIVGLPNAGKSTLFNALTQAHAPTAPYPFTTIDSNIGVAEIPDERIEMIAKATHPERIVRATIKFMDVAGLVKGASHGEGLGNQFLSQIRVADALIHVVRCFKSPDIPHVSGEISPRRDLEIVNLELIFSDLEMAERRLEKVERKLRAGEKGFKEEKEALLKVKEGLEKGIPIRLQSLNGALEYLHTVDFLTDKPLIYVANISEEDIGKESSELKELKEIAEEEKTSLITVPAKIEEEIAQLEPEERKEFLDELGISSSLSQVIKESFSLLNLITFFTIESNEVKAWLVKKGTKTKEAAGKIHSDMEKGFIKAEVVNYKYLVESGSFHQARGRGHHKVEGAEYEVEDGDVILFHFRA